MKEPTLWRLVNNWLASRQETDVYISHNNDHYALMASKGKRDSHIGAIGNDFVVLQPDIVLNAADPDFFEKLDKAITEAKKY